MVCLLPHLLLPLRREKVGTPDDAFLTDEWYIYRNESVCSFWDWSYEKDDFVEIVETRCLGCWAFVAPSQRIYTCPACKVATYCSQQCMSRSKRPEDHGGVLVCSKFRSKLQSGMMATKDERALPSWSVAMRKTVFGEGAERMVHKFRFLDDKTQNFIGPKMVAKESRFVDFETSYQRRMDYHREFMRTQAIASKMAAKFNEALDSLSSHFPARDKSFLDRLPRIIFLAPLLVEVMHQGVPFCTLIEPMLDVAKYEKFNNNMGFVKGQKNQGGLLSVDEHNGAGNNGAGLGAIEEEEEDEDDEDGDLLNSVPSRPDINTSSFLLEDQDFPHAFSHFSYQMSKGSLMVVDLQGVFTLRPNGTRVYELTDSVIHKKKGRRRFRHWTFGRTDRGKKGDPVDACYESRDPLPGSCRRCSRAKGMPHD